MDPIMSRCPRCGYRPEPFGAPPPDRLRDAAPYLLAALQRVFARMAENEAIGFSVDDYEAAEEAIRKATEGQG